ncbi:MAG: diguanylate cyclase [Spirochaetes bacterium]|nr:diguanylate cyclase [Spirochaetota bacterium]
MDHRILFVDDDKETIKIFTRQFGKIYNIDAAKNAGEALKMFNNKNHYSVVIADMRMPGMNGIEFLEKVKEVSPVSTRIMLTGNADLEVAIEAINKGNIFKFLTKPCRKENINDVIKLGIIKYKEEKQLQNESLIDPLTGIWNRRYFDIQVEKEIKNSKKYLKMFSIVFIDINDFKKINDSYGHKIGDEALKFTADILKETCRRADIAARYGGDEFVIFLHHEDKNGALGLVLRLKKIIDKKRINFIFKNLSIAAGVATFPVDGKNIHKLMKISDEEMYRDKLHEKNITEK